MQKYEKGKTKQQINAIIHYAAKDSKEQMQYKKKFNLDTL
jgi:hypothetical protein